MVVIVVLLVMIGLLAVDLIQAQGDVWQFEADRPVEVHSARSLSAPLVRTLIEGEIVTVTGPYVFADNLLWVQVFGADQYVAVARYGVCEIRSFGTYDPASSGPVSVGQ